MLTLPMAAAAGVSAISLSFAIGAIMWRSYWRDRALYAENDIARWRRAVADLNEDLARLNTELARWKPDRREGGRFARRT